MAENERNLIFISHANPEDNDITIWLGSRLALAGYEVWSDLTKLKGGEYFWDDIQEIIQEKAIKVVVIMTTEAMQKKGVKDEIQLAVDTEATLGDNEFVIPIVYKPFDFKKDSPPQIRRKNAISFNNWAAGFTQLMEKLEKDSVPKVQTPNPILESWKTAFNQNNQIIKDEKELLQSNWYPMVLPEYIQFFQVNGIKGSQEVPTVVRLAKCPSREYMRLLVGFGTEQDYNNDLSPSYGVKENYKEVLEDFLEGKPKDVSPCYPREAKKIVTAIVRKGFDNYMASKGLKFYEQSDGHFVWWFPKGLIQKDKVKFLKLDGTQTYRQLYGVAKNNYWHFGIKAKPVLEEESHLTLTPHVIFTNDGIVPIEGKDVMHKKRRSVCRTWRNDKWRDLLSATVFWLFGEEDQATIPLGSENSLFLFTKPILMEAPLSIAIDNLKKEPNSDEYQAVEFMDHADELEEAETDKSEELEQKEFA